MHEAISILLRAGRPRPGYPTSLYRFRDLALQRATIDNHRMPSPDDNRRKRTLAELRPHIERARAFSGWSFGDVSKRYLGQPIPWGYEALAREHLARANSVLDLGTGGGEVLARVIAGSTARVVATEEWHVNAPIAARRLRPLGATVIRADSLRLPFADATFDLILDRHEALDPGDAARVLAPGGTLITQQVGHRNWPELEPFLHPVEFPDHFTLYREGFAAAGLVIDDARWHERPVAFGSLGDIVFMVCVSPWSYPAFDAQRDIDAFLAIEDALTTDDGIVLTEMHYLIVAHNPRPV
jgi:SAM-dependent methyltransferase